MLLEDEDELLLDEDEDDEDDLRDFLCFFFDFFSFYALLIFVTLEDLMFAS